MSGKFALIIGNTEYTDPGLAQLTAPGKDTEDFARVLKDQDIGAFDEVNILLNQPEPVVRGAIDEFFDLKKPDDLLVLYFSGHGVRDELGSLYLAVKNTIRTRLRSTAVKSDYIREVMDQSRSKRQVLILDCCNSGAFSQGAKAATGVSIGTASAFEVGYGRIILTASDSTQFAWEGNQVIGETDNSLFTHFLVEGLKGEADLDGDGRITVDELYDYAYEKVRLATPKQTPSKFSSKQQGEIVLRQNMRIEDIKPVNLPDDLLEEIEDHRPYVREAAVQKLEKILKGRNLGLVRSAADALEKIANDENTTRRISQVATQVLDSYKQVLQKAEEERLAKLEAEHLAEEKRLAEEAEKQRIATQKAEEERVAKARLEAERLAEEKRLADEAEKQRIATQKAAKEERIAKAKLEAERLAEEKQLAAEKADAERKAKEEAELLSAEQKAEEERKVREKPEAERKAQEEVSERAATQEDENEGVELATLRKAERGVKENIVVEERSTPAKSFVLPIGISGLVIIAICIFGYATIRFLPGVFGGVATPSQIIPIPTESPSTKAPTLIPTATATKVTVIPKINIIPTAMSKPVFTSKPDCTTFNVFCPSEYNDIPGIAFSPDGSLIASATWNVGVQIWDIKNNTLAMKIDYYDPTNYKDFAIPDQVAFSPNGQILAVGKVQSYSYNSQNQTTELGKKGGISLYNFSDGKKLLDFKGEISSVRSFLTFSPDGQVVTSLYTSVSDRLYNPSTDFAIGFWQASDGTLLKTIPGKSIAYSPDGEFLASASEDNSITIWQLNDNIPNNIVKTLTAGFAINNVAFLPDGKTLASSGKMGTILWNMSDGTITRTLDTGNGENYAFSPDGQKIAYSICKADCDMYDSDPSNFPILVMRISDGTLLKTFEGHTGMVFGLAFSPDGQILASSARDNIRLWNVASSIEIPQTSPNDTPTASATSNFPVTADAYNITNNSDGSILYYTKSTLENIIKFYRDEYSSKGYRERQALTVVSSSTFSLVFDGDPSGKSLVVQSVDLGDGSRTVSIRLETVE